MGLHPITRWLPTLFTMLLFQHAKAQLPGMKIYTQLDGYPGTIGYHISQDVKGLIWIGTNNGAVCFDGKKFSVVDDKDGLTDKEILHVVPYGEQRVLLLPLLNNIALYRNGKVITAAQLKNSNLITNKISNACYYDKATGKAWLSDSKNCVGAVYCFAGDSIQKVPVKGPAMFDLFGVANNHLYLLDFSKVEHLASVGIYDQQNQLYKPFKFKSKTGKSIDFKMLTSFKVSHDEKYLVARHHIGNKAEIFEINGNELHHLRTVTITHPLRYLYIDRNNHLWATIYPSGIEYWGNLSGREIQHKPFYFFDNIVVNDLLVDRDGNLWFTTERKGLCFISSRHWQNARLSLQLKLPPLPPTYVSGNGINSLYIGHSGNPSFTFIKNGQSTVLNLPKGSPLGVPVILKMNGCVYVVSNMVFKFIEKGNRITYEGVWPHGTVKDIVNYNNKRLVLAKHDNLEILKMENLDRAEPGVRIFEGRTSSVEVLRDGGLLIGTPNGLFLKPFFNQQAVRINSGELKTTYITDIKNAIRGYVLIGTNAQGLYIYNTLTRTASRIQFPLKSSPNSIRDIFCQNDSIYWVSTDKGIVKMLFGKGMNVRNFTAYTFFDGLPSNDATSVYVQHDTAYVATAEGLGILPLNNPVRKSKTPELWLSSIKIEDSLVYSPEGSIDLSNDQNNLQLSISAPSYESMGMLRFMYRLVGLSEKWTETENSEISFSGLSPGKYLFETFAISPEGIRSKFPLSVRITIHPAFWQSLWFRVLLFVLAGAAILFVVYRLVLNKKNKQYREMQQKKRLAELELEAIKAQINPHFVYNCLNSIQYFSYKNDFESVKQYLDIFAKLIRQTMQYSQETFISLEEEINYLNNYLKLEKVRFKDKLNYRLEISKDLDRLAMIPSMLVQPYVENALKHGVAKQESVGQLCVNFSYESENRIKVCIEDNGPGLPGKITEVDRKPLGLRLSGSRAETYNQLFGLDIGIVFEQGESFNSEFKKGTRVKLLIPVIKHGGTLL